MAEEKRTLPKHTAWGKKLIKVLMFQPEQDRTNKSLKRSLLVSCTWNPPAGPWVLFLLTDGLSFLTRKYKKFQTAQKFLHRCKEGRPLSGRGTQRLLLRCFNTKLKAEGFVLLPLPQYLCITQHTIGWSGGHLPGLLGTVGEHCPSGLCISHREEGTWYMVSVQSRFLNGVKNERLDK